MQARPREILAAAEHFRTMGAYRAALRERERLLLLLQRLHGDPSPECDEQKLAIGELVHRIATMSPTERQADAAAEREIRNDPTRRAAGDVVAPNTMLLTESLPLPKLIAFAERLLSPGNMLHGSHLAPRVADVRGKLLLALSTDLHGRQRSRAAIPLAHRALIHLQSAAAGHGGVSADVATAFLTLATLHSAASHHEAALGFAHRALDCVLALEQAHQAHDASAVPVGSAGPSPLPTAAAGATDAHAGASTPHQRLSGAQAANNSTAAAADAATAGAAARRTKLYFGPMQAACHHNIGAEREHLGLLELALESYQTGFEVSFAAQGAGHPLTAMLKRSYADMFASLHFKHFSGQRAAVASAFSDPDKAVNQLRASYMTSVKHQAAQERQSVQERAILRRVLTAPPLDSVGFSATQNLLQGRLRPSSAFAGGTRSHGASGAAQSRRATQHRHAASVSSGGAMSGGSPQRSRGASDVDGEVLGMATALNRTFGGGVQ